MKTPEDNRLHVKEFRQRMRLFVWAQKEAPCLDCGVKYPACVLQFDHVRGKKKFNLSRVSSTFISKKRVLEEIAKCEVVCANCHMIRTWNRSHTLGSSSTGGAIRC